MKDTRIILMALCLMALAWGGTSCKKEKNENLPAEGEMMTIGADIDQSDVGNTKTFLSPYEEGVKVKWSDGEKFTLYGNGSTSGNEFVISKGMGETTAHFQGEVPAGGLPYFAAYPTGGTFDGTNTFTFTVPATISYVAETAAVPSEGGQIISVQKHNAPMVGKSADGKHLQFRNTMSTIMLDLKGGAKVTKIVLTDLSGKKLNGTLTVTLDSDGEIESSSMAGGTSTLTIDLGEGVTLDKDKYSLFCFSVPQYAFAGEEGSKNVKIDIYDVTGSVIKTIEKGLAAGVASNGAYQVVEDRVRPFVLPEGFSVRNGRIVHFTPGNLYYDGSNFHFEENQWTARITNWADSDTIGHFYYSKNISVATQKNKPTRINDRIFPNDGLYTPNMNFTIDGQANKYLALSMEDFQDLRDRKSTIGATGKSLYGMGTVNGVKGIIFLPDKWDATIPFNYGTSSCSNNVYSGTDWEDMEYDGAVFLPIAGYSSSGDGKISNTNKSKGLYWTSKFDIGSGSSSYGTAEGFKIEDGKAPRTDPYGPENWASIRLVYYPQQ